ncbi:MAG: sugar ABC transporter ATP-binding protein [Christensenellaceae bacterium]|nr:sugar ABC transporter ATP-binding protein [Christensenellaceae bacterium]
MEDIIVRLRGIGKAFNGVQVLKDVDLDFKKGEVHALVGENGAGKSTLMKILMGIYDRTEGELAIDGTVMDMSYNINTARKQGINMVPQELALVPALSVGENILMGRKKGKFGFVNIRKIQNQAIPYLEELGIDISPETRVDRLPLSHRQMVSIAKTCADDAKLIIMDEPTSSLSKEEVDELMKVIRKLKAAGKTIIYISHLLDEIFAIADRITVLRDGRHIITKNTDELTQRELVSYMVGEDLMHTQESLREDGLQDMRMHAEDEIPALELKGVTRKGTDKEVSLKLYKGEVVGVTGLVGAGKTELLRSIIGLDKMEKGQIFVEGEAVNIRSPQEAFEHNIAIVPEDRKLEGLVLVRSVEENTELSPKYRKLISKLGFIDKKQGRKDTLKYIDKLSTKVAGLDQKVLKLSGGNQQKIVISKALLSNPKILVMDEPTRGIDVGAKATIYQLLQELKNQGMSILYFSSDVAEMSFVGDRILVMREGEIVKELQKGEATMEKMLNYMAGGNEE